MEKDLYARLWVVDGLVSWQFGTTSRKKPSAIGNGRLGSQIGTKVRNEGLLDRAAFGEKIDVERKMGRGQQQCNRIKEGEDFVKNFRREMNPSRHDD